MAAPQRQTLIVTALVGMNTADPRTSLLPGQARIIENVDLIDGGLGIKRAGFAQVPTAGTPPINLLGQSVIAQHRHVPDGDDASAEHWVVLRNRGIPMTPTLYRFDGATWTVVALPDAPVWLPDVWSFATFNGKLFIAYDSGVNRLHVWDGVSVRRVGLAPPTAAPGLASIGPGALGFTRFYRVRFVSGPGSPTSLLLSEAGPSASITVAASAGVRVTRPALADGNETLWRVEAATSANGPWFELGQILIGTLTFDDTNATIPTTTPAQEAGLYTLPPSAKYLSVYEKQLLMAGAWETTSIAGQSVPKNNRVWFTRPLGSLEISDDEAITTLLTQKFYVDTSEDGDRINGLSYPLNGICYVTKKRQFWSLIPRDSDTAPFAAVRLTDAVGCRDYRTICIGEDEGGDPALYWNSLRGPYRMARGGMQFLGRDIAPDVFGLSSADRALWCADLRQVWFVRSTTTTIHKFNVRYGHADRSDVRNGWTRDVLAGNSPTISSLGIFGRNLAPVNEDLEPVIGGQLPLEGNSFLWQRAPNLVSDDGMFYRGWIHTAASPMGKFLYNVLVYPPRLYAEPVALPAPFVNASTLQCRVFRNFRPATYEVPQSDTDTVINNPFTNAFKLIVCYEGIGWSDAEVYEFEMGDASALEQRWRLLAFVVPYEMAEEAQSPS